MPELADKVKAEGDCLVWTGSRNYKGYGRKNMGNKKNYRTHRLNWAYANDQEIPEGMFILHTCDNPPCLLPAHLWLGTHEDNMRDKAEKGRQSHTGRKKQEFCIRGHSLDVSYIRPNGQRQCRPCRAIRKKLNK